MEETIENQNVENVERKPKNAKKIAIIAVGVVAILGVAGCATYAVLNQTPTTVVEADAETGTATVTLTDGETKIKSGGTYTITGSTSNGQLEINSAEDVKVILSNVSITNPSGAAIKIKGTGKVVLELVGENTLSSTESGDDSAAAISADYDLEITGSGSAAITSKNGKGIKADGTLTLTSGIYNITAGDDAIHSNSNVQIADGTYTISTGDDAVHADNSLTIDGGTINITKSHEGLEAVNLTINGGDISVVADDDGVNAQNSDGSSRVMVAGDGNLTITGGKIYVNATGDGLDSNGSITISGGEIYVDGPTNSANSAVDCDGEISITGGTLIAVGASGMAQNATSATQPSILINLSGNYSGELSFGGITYTPAKSYQSVLISSSSLKVGETYTLTIGGQEVQSVTISQNITGQGGMGGGMMGGAMGGQMGGAPDQQGQQTGQQQNGRMMQRNR